MSGSNQTACQNREFSQTRNQLAEKLAILPAVQCVISDKQKYGVVKTLSAKAFDQPERKKIVLEYRVFCDSQKRKSGWQRAKSAVYIALSSMN